jgi:hypothetical protein
MNPPAPKPAPTPTPKPKPKPAPKPKPKPTPKPTPKPKPPALSADRAMHLLSRFSFGATPSSLAYLAKYGASSWWQEQLAVGRAHSGYSAHPTIAASGPLLAQTPAAVRSWLKSHGNEYGWDAMDQLTQVTVGLQTWSPAQLYETVVDFFANHLNVANHNGDLWNTRHTMDRDVIRKYAFGTFSDMLVASARNPAMLQYLNLADSDKDMVNENYGRELLELHTVGLHYTEADVQNSAKVLTGRKLDQWDQYDYVPSAHYVGPVEVLGWSHRNAASDDGQAVGDQYLRYLALHPYTAQNLARKLCIRFVSDTPSATLVATVARAYTANKSAIVPTLEAIFNSSEFWSSRRKKVRRPTENLLATIRILGINPSHSLVTTLQTLHWMTSDLGQVPLDWAPPNGYPDTAADWRSSGTLLDLWEFHRGLAQGWWTTAFTTPNLAALYGSAKTSGAVIANLGVRLHGVPLPANAVAAMQTYLDEPASTLLTNSALRWRTGDLVPLYLDAPQHALR